jgi:hypothetical protein
MMEDGRRGKETGEQTRQQLPGLHSLTRDPPCMSCDTCDQPVCGTLAQSI